MPTPVAQKAFSASLILDGVTIPGPWDGFQGLETTAEATSFPPGHELPDISLGGPPTDSDITLSRYYDLDTVHGMYEWMRARVGSAQADIGISFHRNKRPVAGGPRRTGTLTGLSVTDGDASSSDPFKLNLVFRVDGP